MSHWVAISICAINSTVKAASPTHLALMSDARVDALSESESELEEDIVVR